MSEHKQEASREDRCATCRILASQLFRCLERLHLAVKDCARIGFQESSPTTNAHHASIWDDLNEAQKDAALKLKHFRAKAVSPSLESQPTYEDGLERAAKLMDELAERVLSGLPDLCMSHNLRENAKAIRWLKAAPPATGTQPSYEWQCMNCSFVTRDEQRAADHQTTMTPLHAYRRITLGATEAQPEEWSPAVKKAMKTFNDAWARRKAAEEDGADCSAGRLGATETQPLDNNRCAICGGPLVEGDGLNPAGCRRGNCSQRPCIPATGNAPQWAYPTFYDFDRANKEYYAFRERKADGANWADDHSLAEAHKRDCELMLCGHMRKQAIYYMPGGMGCLQCERDQARAALRALAESQSRELERLRGAIEKYARHTWRCDIQSGRCAHNYRECTCGFAESCPECVSKRAALTPDSTPPQKEK